MKILFSRFNYKSTIVFPNSLWIQLSRIFYENIIFFRKFTLNSIFQYLFREYTLHSLSIPQIYYEFTIFFRELTMYLLYFALNHYELTNFFRDNTFHPLSLSCIRNCSPKFTMNPREEFKFTIFFAESLWIYFIPWINYGFMIFVVESLWIYYLCCKIILN